MRVLKNEDYQLFERLVSLSQKEIQKTMGAYLQSKYEKVIYTKEYIVAIGDIPIALVAHMDTVYQFPVTNLYYDQRKGVFWSPEGLGADDRAGIFAIIQIIKSGFRPSIILTTDEEKGGLGASALAEKECPIPNLKYMIQLDRRGTNDCVFYDCYNPSFIKYIEEFGFIEKWGSFSDISFLMPAWRICGTNLSVGYEDEHSVSETLHIRALYDTIEKVKKMLQVAQIPDFKYEELQGGFRYFKNLGVYSDGYDFGAHCAKCKMLFSEYELFPVKGADGKTKFYCPDCIVSNVDWCERCGEAYEVTDPTRVSLCNDCAGGQK